jgi:hypothetical protein
MNSVTRVGNLLQKWLLLKAHFDFCKYEVAKKLATLWATFYLTKVFTFLFE